MDIKTLSRLQKLNQLNLTETEENELMAFFEKAEKDAEILASVDTENVERMVYVMPMTNIIREDIAKKVFTRDQLQEQAPEAMDGYWQVPRLVE
ncbi:MAG: Asp-tRNA(Asn)/Glu-tRNA(Gln) amidotransferase subunit GatC [Oscillospiraceae bacterium]|nr:Asp-tRNA(Asn)/Glu-tRNA(Gln) amidotransferase subunit GatC [Oscillospiraceae bacterium]